MHFRITEGDPEIAEQTIMRVKPPPKTKSPLGVLIPNKAWVGDPGFATNICNRLSPKMFGVKSVYASVKLKNGKLKVNDVSSME
jgi:hypothetical protein